jgi:hypothetical protein
MLCVIYLEDSSSLLFFCVLMKPVTSKKTEFGGHVAIMGQNRTSWRNCVVNPEEKNTA